MVPLPIALLALVYAAVATASAVSVWRVASGASQQQLVWPLAWLALSVAAMCGLALLRPWARRLAIIGLVVITTVVLAVAALLVMAGRPLGAIAATSAAALHVVMIRYLQRPSVRAYFQP
jgi:hypothetical protein